MISTQPMLVLCTRRSSPWIWATTFQSPHTPPPIKHEYGFAFYALSCCWSFHRLSGSTMNIYLLHSSVPGHLGSVFMLLCVQKGKAELWLPCVGHLYLASCVVLPIHYRWLCIPCMLCHFHNTRWALPALIPGPRQHSAVYYLYSNITHFVQSVTDLLLSPAFLVTL